MVCRSANRNSRKTDNRPSQLSLVDISDDELPKCDRPVYSLMATSHRDKCGTCLSHQSIYVLETCHSLEKASRYD